MIERSRQYGVPVITAGSDVIVGFDQPRLERLAERVKQQKTAPKFGLLARDIKGGGVEAGGTRPGSPAERAGFQRGDLLEALDGTPVRSLAELESLLRRLPTGTPVEARVRRGDERVTLRLTLG